ncbi:MAG: GNAT family protein [Acidobacteriaceae bacterium]
MPVSNMEDSWPIGIPVDPLPEKRPEPTFLRGRLVTLAPLDPRAHSEALYESTHGPKAEQLWLYLFDGPFPNLAAFTADLQQKANSSDSVFLAILDNASGSAVGYSSFMRIEPAHRCMEIGNVVFSPGLQRTPSATEAMYLMARHAFEDLGYRRYEWKCNALHRRSHRAALRLGFTFEGIFRQHLIVKGRNRDTAWFSILDSEWPTRKANLERWLAPDNFDMEGRQKLSLSKLNADTLCNGKSGSC